MVKPVLTREFQKQARLLDDAMEKLPVRFEADFDQFLSYIPELNLPHWGFGSSSNCYGFALNKRIEGGFDPGDIVHGRLEMRDRYLSRLTKLNDMHALIHEVVQEEGLRALGDDLLSVRAGECPIALFFNDHARADMVDYHWVALRKQREEEGAFKLVWAHKMGLGKPAEICSDRGDPIFRDKTNVFNTAMISNYQHFAGYYAVPANLDDPAEKVDKALNIVYCGR